MKKKEVSQTKLNFWTIWTVLKLQVLVKSILCKSVLCLMPKKKNNNNNNSECPKFTIFSWF